MSISNTQVLQHIYIYIYIHLNPLIFSAKLQNLADFLIICHHKLAKRIYRKYFISCGFFHHGASSYSFYRNARQIHCAFYIR